MKQAKLVVTICYVKGGHKIKKILLVLIIALLVLTACSNETTEDEVIEPETNSETASTNENDDIEVKVEPEPEPEPGPEEELELEYLTVTEYLNQAQPIIIYSYWSRYLNDDYVPIEFRVIKDNLITTYALDEDVVGPLEDFVKVYTDENEEQYTEWDLKEMIDLYDMTDEDIIKYLDSSKAYKAIHKDRPYILGSI